LEWEGNVYDNENKTQITSGKEKSKFHGGNDLANP
jgi:hypothetical protein